MRRLLIVDDEVKLLRILKGALQKKGYRVETAATGAEARRKMAAQPADIVFLDLMLPDVSGLELLEEWVSLYPHKFYIMMTAYGDIESAVSAMKAGAFDYMVKPVQLDNIQLVIDKACEWLQMKEENRQLREKLKSLESAPLVGTSPAMKSIIQLVERVANTDANVLIQGESGTGKSMIARLIHLWSGRQNGPFISVNCAAIPEQLLESELFGYEKGAFTGATTSRPGKFEAADGGTIFLDEIGEVNPALQAKLLQVTQDKTFMRLGSNKTKTADVRLISASNRDLKKMVESGDFREDLYYRLNIVDIHIPPLRERREDIPVLVETFLNKQRHKNGIDYSISPELMNVLTEYDWPGNVRELENAIERAVILCRNHQLSVEDFPREVRERKDEPSSLPPISLKKDKSLPELLEEMEKQLIMQALDETGGKVAEAARKLGISRQNLFYKMNKYFIN
ncbi:DNA-binding NtrC family response regulator [Caldalkalibacillus uzonensis]|uniref:DNA-binding NtrC family response regulator n=1 Tax=Caldalkalibacillus uzonensis TaxID=353224 RepID=A0ABU0CLW0_9BACI|nr:sigma-54 dependent transcriptional regulator [Caldalkalibacillus uzonensis]MDQ0337404.1 DNA-binding NtrC family response regulator [Caldalkalibacillus uzonensis]